MAKKHFEEYYEKFKKNNDEVIEMTKTFVELLNKGEVDEERVNNFTMSAEAVTTTFQTMQKIKKLLDLPEDYERKEKPPTFIEDVDKIVDGQTKFVSNMKEMVEENDSVIDVEVNKDEEKDNKGEE